MASVRTKTKRLTASRETSQHLQPANWITKITIELTQRQAEQLLWLYHRGVLQDLNIDDVEIIGDASARAIVDRKSRDSRYDVFMCHASADKRHIKKVAMRLHRFGILPWLDEWQLRPGLPWQRALEEQIDTIKSAAIFVGVSGIGPWQDMEIDAFLRQFVGRACPVIPVLLRGCKSIPKLPAFLDGMTWVDFNKRNPDPYSQLVWGITGEKIGATAKTHNYSVRTVGEDRPRPLFAIEPKPDR